MVVHLGRPKPCFRVKPEACVIKITIVNDTARVVTSDATTQVGASLMIVLDNISLR
jgi:hypothetical protein